MTQVDRWGVVHLVTRRVGTLDVRVYLYQMCTDEYFTLSVLYTDETDEPVTCIACIVTTVRTPGRTP